MLSGDGRAAEAGDLILASTNVPKFVDALKPVGTGEQGCWEAWQDPVAGDMGDSILSSSGIELPKAPGFRSPEPSEVNGRLAWTEPESRVDWSSCANDQGQIEWARRANLRILFVRAYRSL